MSVLRSIEHRIESIVEGVFGRAFRTHVQPVELARKLAKEMDEAKTISVSRVYVPNEYTLYLAPGDRDQFSSYEDSLLTELADYLSEHARREGYALLSTPRVLMEEDNDLSVGEFGIATRMVEPQRPKAPVPPGVVPQEAPGSTRIYKPPPAVTAAVSPEEAVEHDLAHASPVLLVGGKRHELSGRTVVLGRSRECDITLDDPNVSRRHAEVRPSGGKWTVRDLGSTNGIRVNGRRVDGAQSLNPGDVIEMGRSSLTFEEE